MTHRPHLMRRIAAVIAGGALAATLVACGPAPADGNLSQEPPAPTASAPSSAPSSQRPDATETTPTKPSTSKPTTSKPKKTAPAVLLKAGDKGEDVRDLQVRLREISWYVGTISGSYDDATVEAVRGFQAKRGLPETGKLDRTTWKRLTEMTSEPTHDQKHNVLKPGKAILKEGSTGDQVKELQARLKQIGWFAEDVTGTYGQVTVSAVKGFQEKREIPVTGEVDQRTWDRLVAMTRTPTQEELDNKPAEPKQPGALDKRCLTGRVMCVDKSTSTLSWVVDGKVVKVMDARFGCQGMETREGVFQVGWKSRNHTSTDYNTWMPYAMFFSGGQAVHYSPDFAARGYNGCSHGCVNIRDKAGITWLFDQVQVGDKVVVHW